MITGEELWLRNPTLARVAGHFGARSPADPAESFLAYRYRRSLILDRSDGQESAVDQLLRFQDVLEQSTTLFRDYLGPESAAARKPIWEAFHHTLDTLTLYVEDMKGRVVSEADVEQVVEYLDGLAVIALNSGWKALVLGRIMAGVFVRDRTTFLTALGRKKISDADRLIGPVLEAAVVDRRRLMNTIQEEVHFLTEDPDRARLDVFAVISEHGLDRVEPAAPEASANAVTPNYDLDFEILPAGTSAQEIANFVVGRNKGRGNRQIDRDRVGVLDALRDEFGSERCSFAIGRRRISGTGGSAGRNIDEDYILLVIKNYGRDGLGSEDAVAISPIAGMHAAFYSRFAASQVTWRDAFAQSKRDARNLGVRRLVFQPGKFGMDRYAAMREKISALAACDPDDFYNRLDFNPHSRSYDVDRS